MKDREESEVFEEMDAIVAKEIADDISNQIDNSNDLIEKLKKTLKNQKNRLKELQKMAICEHNMVFSPSCAYIQEVCSKCNYTRWI